MTLAELSACIAALAPRRAEIAVLIAAHNGNFGPRERLMVSAVLRRPGAHDARFRALHVSHGFITSDSAAHSAALRTLTDQAQQLGIPFLSVEGRATAVAAEQWIRQQGPAPEVTWTTEYAWHGYDAEGVTHAQTAVQTHRGATPHQPAHAHPFNAGAHVAGTLTTRVLELEEHAHVMRLMPTGSVSRRTLRALSAQGTPASQLFALHPPTSPLDAMLSLAAAWDAPLQEVASIAALLRGERCAGDVDRELERVCEAHRDAWMFALRVEEAFAAGQATTALVEEARSRGVHALLEALRDVPGLEGRSGKWVIARLDALGDGACEAGALWRLAEARR